MNFSETSLYYLAYTRHHFTHYYVKKHALNLQKKHWKPLTTWNKSFEEQ